MNACWQKKSNCGDRNVTISDTDSSVTLTGKGLNSDNACSWIVKAECGLPIVSILEKAESITEANAKLTYVEWQPSLLKNHGEDQWAPNSKQVIPKMFKPWTETIGYIPKITYEGTKYEITDLETGIKAYNKLVSTYKG